MEENKRENLHKTVRALMALDSLGYKYVARAATNYSAHITKPMYDEHRGIWAQNIEIMATNCMGPSDKIYILREFFNLENVIADKACEEIGELINKIENDLYLTSVDAIIDEHAIKPFYATRYSAGMDIAAAIPERRTIWPGEMELIPTGIRISMPAGMECQLRARSGLAIKHGVTLINGIGTIDADYRGEIKVGLINHGKNPFTIEPGMRIAQMVFARFERVRFEEVESLDETERNENGFGSTGLQ